MARKMSTTIGTPMAFLKDPATGLYSLCKVTELKAYKWHPFKCCRCGTVQSCAHMPDRFNCDICDRCDHGERWMACKICAPTVDRRAVVAQVSGGEQQLSEGAVCCWEAENSDFYFPPGFPWAE